MSSLAVAVAVHAVLVAAPLANDEAAIGPMEPPVSCGFLEPASAEGVAELTLAPAGGRWWLARHDENGQLRFDPNGVFTAVAGDGTVHALSDRRVTPAALSIAVPTSLSAGQALQLRVDDLAIQGVLLQVSEGEPEESQVAIVGIDVDGTTPETCEMSCRFEGMTVPAAPLLRLTYSGGPAILDAWATAPGMPEEDLTPRVVDSELLPASDVDTTVELRLDELGFTSDLDVRVRLLSPDTLTVLHDEFLAVAPLAEVPAETVADVPICETPIVEPMPSFGCSAVPTEAASFAVPLLLFGAWRRRRRRARG